MTDNQPLSIHNSLAHITANTVNDITSGSCDIILKKETYAIQYINSWDRNKSVYNKEANKHSPIEKKLPTACDSFIALSQLFSFFIWIDVSIHRGTWKRRFTNRVKRKHYRKLYINPQTKLYFKYIPLHFSMHAIRIPIWNFYNAGLLLNWQFTIHNLIDFNQKMCIFYTKNSGFIKLVCYLTWDWIDGSFKIRSESLSGSREGSKKNNLHETEFQNGILR